MTSLNKNLLLLISTVLAVIGLSAAFSGAPQPIEGTGFFVVVGILEIVIYFIFAMISNPRATLGMAAGNAVFLAVLRLLCAVFGSILYDILSDSQTPTLLGWGHPIGSLIQVILMVITGHYIIALIAPGLIGNTMLQKLEGTTGRRGPVGSEATPSGGFVQVFSFEELAAVLKKSRGLEGFVIYSSEGLVVWCDIPMKLDVDSLSAKMLQINTEISDLTSETGLSKIRRVIIESREHYLFTTMLNQNFGILLIFNARTTTEEILGKLAVLAKTTREFLQWKYPSLQIKQLYEKE